MFYDSMYINVYVYGQQKINKKDINVKVEVILAFHAEIYDWKSLKNWQRQSMERLAFPISRRKVIKLPEDSSEARRDEVETK